MKFGEFMAALNRGEPKRVYLLAGEEDYYIGRAKERILSILGANTDKNAVQRTEGTVSPDDIVAAAATVPFFTDKNILLVVNPSFLREKKTTTADDEAADKEKNAADKKLEGLIKFLGNVPPESYIIFELNGKVDKRRRIVKTIDKYGAVLDADRLRPYEINDFLQGKLQSLNRELTPDATAFFMEAANMMQPVSLSYLDKEFDKLALYAKERRITKKELAESFSGVPEVSGFALADAIAQKDVVAALRVLMRQINDGAYMPLVVAVVANQVRRLLQTKLFVKNRMSEGEIAKNLKLHPFIAKKQIKAAASFAEEKLTAAITELSDADYRMKTGNGGNELLESVIIKLCER